MRSVVDLLGSELGVYGSALTLISQAPLIWAETGGPRRLRPVFKPLASVGFLMVGAGAVGAAGQAAPLPAAALMAALLLCFVGDLLLLSDDKKVFLGGLGAFLLGHVGFVVTFGSRDPDPTRMGLAALALAPVLVGVLRWLWPHLRGPMRPAVTAYVLVIGAMAVSATGIAAGRPATALGALLFVVSDLFVARNRFVAPGPLNRVVGLPLYYAGQLLLAATALRTEGPA
jgi:uncharacterized membrane protein YhhN